MMPAIVRKLAAAFIGIWAMICQAQNHYVVTDLGTLSAGSTIARKINAWGHAAATSEERDGGGAHAALWKNSAKSLVLLSALDDSDHSEATGINNRGEIAGLSNTKTNMHAVLWSISGAIKDLGALPGDTGSRAFAINDRGKVVGLSSGPRGERRSYGLLTAWLSWRHRQGRRAQRRTGSITGIRWSGISTARRERTHFCGHPTPHFRISAYFLAARRVRR
jgi:probable HAF family extracellular repeat protein